MKKLLLFTLFTGAAIGVSAQAISITQADIASVGETKYQVVDTLPSANMIPGNAGISQTWNFSNLHQHVCDTLSFVNPVSTPAQYASQFPASNMAVKLKINGKPGFYYAKKDANAFFMLGAVGDLANTGTMMVAPFNTGFSLIRFASTYLDAYNETYATNIKMVAPPNPYGADSIRQVSHKVLTSTIDAWGSITTPSGTYNAIRQFVTEYSTDTLWGHMPIVGWQQAQTGKDTTTAYRWWTNGMGFPVAEMEYDINLNKATKVNFYMANPAVGINTIVENNNIIVFPNPADNVMSFNLPESLKKATRIEITNILGEVIANSSVNSGEKTFSISTSNLSEGVYFLRIQGLTNQQIHRFIVKH